MKRLLLLMLTGLGCGQQVLATDNQLLAITKEQALDGAIGAATALAFVTKAYPYWWKLDADQAVVNYHRWRFPLEQGGLRNIGDLNAQQKRLVIKEIGNFSAASLYCAVGLYSLANILKLSARAEGFCMGAVGAFLLSGELSFWQLSNFIGRNQVLQHDIMGNLYGLAAIVLPSVMVLYQAYRWWNHS